MYISNQKELLKAIDNLNNRKIIEENNLLNKLYGIKQQMDPVFQVNKLLPRKVPAVEVLNNLFDETIIDATHLITDKLNARSTYSLLKKTGSNFLQLTISGIVNNNAYKIKAISLAILKNIIN
jgi:hypothetical protein